MRRLVQPFVLVLLACLTAPVLVVAEVALGRAGGGAVLLLAGAYAALVLVLRVRRPDLRLPAPGELPECSLSEVCRAWLRSSAMLHRPAAPAAVRLRLARLRQAYLDELEIRDPAGFLRWVTAIEVRVDPTPYFVRR